MKSEILFKLEPTPKSQKTPKSPEGDFEEFIDFQ
jgi:hypothetical protein